MNAAELLVECLKREGIDFIFGLPGEENADLMMALEGSGLRFVLCRHEQGAAFMAEAYGRLTGSPPVCIATLGPGATNLLTAIADANMDHAPVIAVCGQGAVTRLHKESHQIIDIERLFEPVTKWSMAIRDPDSIPEIVRKAVRLARAEKPGAVMLELPEDIASETAETTALTPHRFRRPAPDGEAVAAACTRLAQAKRPVIIAGNGAIRTRASHALRAFCEDTGIGVMSTFMGKGAVDMDAAYCLYTIGLSQKDYVSAAIEDADLVLTVGYDMVEYPPKLWNPGCATDVLHIDFLPAEIDADYQPSLEIVGDLAAGLTALHEGLNAHGIPKYDLDGQARVRAAMGDDLSAHSDDDTEGAIRPQKAVWDTRQALGPNDIVLSGVGAHKMWVARYYHCHEPNTCLIPNGFCSMGAALPGAIGAKLAVPDARIVAIAGDGDFLMNVQEMETARRLDLDIVVMVWVDGEYGLIAWKQDNEFGHHTDLAFGNPDWLKLATSFGWQGQVVENARDLRSALDKALSHKGPSLIALPIDYRENALLTERLGTIEMNI